VGLATAPGMASARSRSTRALLLSPRGARDERGELVLATTLGGALERVGDVALDLS
jgi:hypothetical protein